MPTRAGDLQPADSPVSSTIERTLHALAAKHPCAVALTAPGRDALAYGALHSAVERLVTRLNALGIGRGDRVAIVLPNGPEMAVAFLAVAAGATAAPLNPEYRAAEFDFYLNDLGARALIVPGGSAGADSPSVVVARERAIPILEADPVPGAPAGIFGLSGDERPTAARTGFASPDDVAVVLHTSGSTARPKMVPLTHANVCASARNVARTLGLAPSDRCMNVMPLFHIHGLVAALLASLTAGASVACTEGFDAPRFFEALDELEPTWYTAVPTMHQAVVDRAAGRADVIARRPLRFIRSSSSALAPRLMAALERAFGVPVVEAYGMTEASHQVASNPLPPLARKPGSVGIAAGPEVAIADGTGALVPTGTVGEIVIRGANVTAGYESNPAANASSFTNGWFRTGDRGRIDDDGYLFIEGRIKEIINRGGEKISPREIDEALLEHPAVAHAVAFAVPDPKLGEDVAAAIVLRDGAATTERELREFVAERLATFKVPRRVVFVAEIPKGPTGKLQRTGLAEKLGVADGGERRGSTAPRVAPESETELRVATIWTDVLGIEDPGARDDFFESGGDSILAAKLLARVRALLGVEIAPVGFFEEATIAALASAVEHGRRDPVSFAIPRRADPSTFPLSFAQERLWFLEQFDPGGYVYNRPTNFVVTGPLDAALLERALCAILARHATLRATFAVYDGRPVQIIAPESTIRLAVTDLSALAPDDREEALARRAAEEARRPFDLERGPLLRAQLVRLGPERHVLLLTIHHIAFDGWSASVLVRELAAFYDALRVGARSELPGLPVEYADFAVWQRDAMRGDRLERMLAYWRERLGGDLAPLDLPADRARTATRASDPGRVLARIPADATRAITEVGRREHATTYMVLLAAFASVLHRYTGRDDVVIGTLVAGRSHVETEGMIGCFVNTLAMRVGFDGDPTFRELLGRVRAGATGAYAHQELPFEKLVDVLQPQRDSSRSPVFNVLFQLRNLPSTTTTSSDIRFEGLEASFGIANLDLLFEATERDGEIHCVFTYDTGLFDGARIERLAGHLCTLVSAGSRRPDERVSALPLLTDGERHRILVEWNDTGRVYDLGRPLHRVFEARAASRPNATAVLSGDESVTFGELNARANRLARHLHALGVRTAREDRVGCFVYRGVDLVVAMLATLKAGAVFVPLDPTYTDRRLAAMLEDSRPSVVISRSELIERLAPDGRRVVLFDRDAEAIAGRDTADPPSPVASGDLAFLLYTSGSTGRPKGVALEHLALLACFAWTADVYPFLGGDVQAQLASAGFADALHEILLPLLGGVPSAIIADEDVRDVERLVAALARYGVTHSFMVPSLLGAVLERFPDLARHLPRLRMCLVGGEPLAPSIAEAFSTGAPHASLLNNYGSTEAFDAAMWKVVSGSSLTVPIGGPEPNMRLYVLDASLQPVPIGVPGELHVSGPTLARGYWNRPDLTAERFVPNPFEDGTRMYRTGDLARYLPDGTLELLGRVDDMVKIRGIRVEPGEIEARLREHPEVRDAVVVAHLDANGDPSLAVYVVSRAVASPDPSRLRAHLRGSLPPQAIPSAFAFVDAFPLTATGKVDRRNLPRIEASSFVRDGASVAPRTPVEARLARVWSDLLGAECASVHDDFFQVGGHSLLVTRLVSRVRAEFGVEVPLRAVFDAPTVAGLATAIRQRLDDSARSVPTAIPRARRVRLTDLASEESNR